MKTLAATALLACLAVSARADSNIRAVCEPKPWPFSGICIAEYPGVYAGGDTVFFWHLSDSHFALSKPEGLISLSTTALATPICTRWTNLGAATDSYLAPIRTAAYVKKAWCITSGTIVTAPEIALSECDSAGASCSDNSTSLVCDGDGDSTETFAGAGGNTVDTDDWMQANVTNTPSVTTGETVFCFVSAVPQ